MNITPTDKHGAAITMKTSFSDCNSLASIDALLLLQIQWMADHARGEHNTSGVRDAVIKMFNRRVQIIKEVPVETENSSNGTTILPDGSAFSTATIMSKEEAMKLPLKDRPLNLRISSDMYHGVFEAIGEASMQWHGGPGDRVFDSEGASAVAVRLCFKIAEELEAISQNKGLQQVYIKQDPTGHFWMQLSSRGSFASFDLTELARSKDFSSGSAILEWAAENCEPGTINETPKPLLPQPAEANFFSAICKGRPMDKALEEFRQNSCAILQDRINAGLSEIVKRDNHIASLEAKLEESEKKRKDYKTSVFKAAYGSVSETFCIAVGHLAKAVHETAVSKGWWETDRNDGEMMMLMVSELAEGFEYLRNHNGPSDHITGFLGIEEEYADTVIRILDACHKRGYRIGEAIIAKMAYNKTRPVKHGGKKF